MARQDTKCYNLKEEKKKTYVTYKVWYHEFSRISNLGIAIIEKWIAFHDRVALNSNPDGSQTLYESALMIVIYKILIMGKEIFGNERTEAVLPIDTNTFNCINHSLQNIL